MYPRVFRKLVVVVPVVIKIRLHARDGCSQVRMTSRSMMMKNGQGQTRSHACGKERKKRGPRPGRTVASSMQRRGSLKVYTAIVVGLLLVDFRSKGRA